jgi:hypothetical protein
MRADSHRAPRPARARPGRSERLGRRPYLALLWARVRHRKMGGLVGAMAPLVVLLVGARGWERAAVSAVLVLQVAHLLYRLLRWPPPPGRGPSWWLR